jgi:hypothetical protein
LALLTLTTSTIDLTQPTTLQKWKATLDFLKLTHAFVNIPPHHSTALVPRVFQGAFDKVPAAQAYANLRLTVFTYLCRPTTFTALSNLATAFSAEHVPSQLKYASLQMMTTVTELAFGIFRGSKSLFPVHKFRERLRMPDPSIDVDGEYRECSASVTALGRFLYTQTVHLIHTEMNPSVLSVAQLPMTAALLRVVALEMGVLDTTPSEEAGDDGMEGVAMGVTQNVAAMQMAARLAFEGLCTETGRRDIFDWSVNWFKRQMELDCSLKGQGRGEPDTVGHPGVLYRAPSTNPCSAMSSICNDTGANKVLG